MNTEFNWWLLIVGLVAGGALVWLVLADSSRRDADVEDEELPAEATWIAETMRDAGEEMAPETAEQVLRLHRAFLALPPPDEPVPAPAAPTVAPAADQSRDMAHVLPTQPTTGTRPATEGLTADRPDTESPDAVTPRRRRSKAAPPAD